MLKNLKAEEDKGFECLLSDFFFLVFGLIGKGIIFEFKIQCLIKS